MFDDNWKLVDAFTLDQAAFLWCGLDPDRDDLEYAIFDRPPSNVIAARQMLIGAIELGQLPSKPKYQYQTLKGRADGNNLIFRTDLSEFAKSKKQFPAFLFDTIAPETGNGDRPLPKNKGGVDPKFNWDRMFAEIVRLAMTKGLPEKQEPLAGYLERWFACGMNDPDAAPDDTPEFTPPGRSTLMGRLSPIYSNLKDMGWPGKKIQEPPVKP